MNRKDIIVRVNEILHERVSLDELDAMAINYLKTCVERCKALDEAEIMLAPVIKLKDFDDNKVHEFGKNVHDRLKVQRVHVSTAMFGKAGVLTANLLAYENIQNGDGSFGGYEIQTDDEDGYMPCRSVIVVNDKIFPRENKHYCDICGSEHNLHHITMSNAEKFWYCDDCKKQTTDYVRSPKTRADKVKNLLMILNDGTEDD